MTASLRFEQRPAVHMLCRGAYLQARLHLSPALVVLPLKPMGFRAEAMVASKYAEEVCSAIVDSESVDRLVHQGNKSNPLLAIIAFGGEQTSPEALEQSARPALERARLIVSWSAGEIAIPFAFVTATKEQTLFRMLPESSRYKQRLGLGNTDTTYTIQLSRMLESAERDEHFFFALSLYQEALREEHIEFRVARFFACLEALAYRLKAKHGGKSRDAVRDLLGIADGAVSVVPLRDHPPISFDRIEIGGRIRDKLFHGVPFDGSSLSTASRDGYAWLRRETDFLSNLLLTDCEVEFARWANGTSRGLPEASA